MRSNLNPAAAILALSLVAGACADPYAPVVRGDTEGLATRLNELRDEHAIPGMAAGIAIGGEIVWTRGFGRADVASATLAADSTVFHLASLTKTFASVVILQLVEEGVLGLDDPVSMYGVTMPNASDIRVRHLLSHTSHGVPGAGFRYDGDRFGHLGQVIASASGEPFMRQAANRIILPLGLTRTGPSSMSHASSIGLDTAGMRAAFARGYEGDPAREVAYPTHMGVSAGMVSNVRDMLGYALALGADELMSPASRALAFTPVPLSGGRTSPYGLGWFSTTHAGQRVVWHYGYWTGNSSLIMLVPSRDAVFVLLANSDGLSREFALGAGELESSPFARAFLEWLGGF